LAGWSAFNGGDISLSAFASLGGPGRAPANPPSSPGTHVSNGFVSSPFPSFDSGPIPGQVAGTSDSFIGGLVGIQSGHHLRRRRRQ